MTGPPCLRSLILSQVVLVVIFYGGWGNLHFILELFSSHSYIIDFDPLRHPKLLCICLIVFFHIFLGDLYLFAVVLWFDENILHFYSLVLCHPVALNLFFGDSYTIFDSLHQFIYTKVSDYIPLELGVRDFAHLQRPHKSLP
ncbi:hypothetical protein ES703_120457 [subsurface metagenome]